MKRSFKRWLEGLVRLYDHSRGERVLKLVEVNDSPQEVYRITTTNNGEVVIYCTETVYEVHYDAWWAFNKRHYSYHVYGHCSQEIPQELSERLRKGFRIGRLLPHMASIKDQKKAAIHGYMSLILQELSVREHHYRPS